MNKVLEHKAPNYFAKLVKKPVSPRNVQASVLVQVGAIQGLKKNSLKQILDHISQATLGGENVC